METVQDGAVEEKIGRYVVYTARVGDTYNCFITNEAGECVEALIGVSIDEIKDVLMKYA